MIEKIIKKRKSIRQFNPHSIDIEKILKILEVARFAPSGKNRQPWRIKILEKNDKDVLIELLKNVYRNRKNTGSLDITLEALTQSDKTLLFFNPYSYIEENYTMNRMLMDTQSIGAFIQNFLLLSTEMGISTLWINDIFYAKDQIEEFYTNKKYEIIAAVAVGYSSRSRSFNIRKELDEILF